MGAGPAGLTVADELAPAGVRIIVVESGGMAPDPASDALGRADVDSGPDHYPNPQYLRARAVGGTSHRWCVDIDGAPHLRLGRLDVDDLRSRHWVPGSGWPLTEDELNPFVDRALRRAGVDPAAFEPSRWAVDTDARRPFPATGRWERRMFLFVPAERFGAELVARVASSPRVMILTHSTSVGLETMGGGAVVRRVRVRHPGGGFTVAARVIVLAQGAFDVPRLLLSSTGETPWGLGNRHDLVGRFLTDHQLVKAGRLVVARGVGERLRFFDVRAGPSGWATGALTVADSARKDEELLGSTMLVAARPRFSASSLLERPLGRETTMRAPVRTGAAPAERARHVVRRPDDLAYAALRYRRFAQPRYSIDRGGWSDGASRRPHRVFDIVQICEQGADAENRVGLGSGVDELGQRRMSVRFRWSDRDRDSARRAQLLLAEEVAAAGIGRFRPADVDGEPAVRQMSAHHPAGTTRMADRPERGVVDPQCRVFGTRNLFVASSSVFPTSTATTPTLTIVALAMRVAETVLHHLGLA